MRTFKDQLTFDKSANFIGDAPQYLAGEVSSNFRLGMLPRPLAFEKAEGPILHYVDGNRLIDGSKVLSKSCTACSLSLRRSKSLASLHLLELVHAPILDASI